VSQQQLTQALNVNYTTVNRWENGKSEPSNLAQRTFFQFCEGNLVGIPAELKDKKIGHKERRFQNGESRPFM